MEDTYFKNKANEVLEAILSDWKKQNFSNSELVEIEHHIYIALKEACRDQRYACADAVEVYIRQTGGSFVDSMCNRMRMEIYNANIKDKQNENT